MRIPPPTDPPKYFTTFSVDAMFFHGARSAYAAAQEAKKGIANAEKQMFLLRWKMGELNEKYEMEEGCVDVPSGYYDELEPLALQMENAEYKIVESHGPVLQQLSLVHILCTASLEAHINIRAEARLSRREWKAFERMAMDAKWLFFPRLSSLSGFDPGHQPYQDFEKLVKIRNALVHYPG